MHKLCVGLLTYCNSKTHPERYEIIKKCVDSFKNLVEENVYIYALDNGSSSDVIEYLRASPYIDDIYEARNNLYDVLAVNFLIKKAKQINATYVMHLEDDFFFYENNFVDNAIEFLEKNSGCGYLRILKYDWHNKEIYNKLANHPDKDLANCQRHFNAITNEGLIWARMNENIGNFCFYVTNWHWYNFANICRLEVF